MRNNMDILEKKQHYIVLFDCYENLLTDKQRQYFKDYYSPYVAGTKGALSK